MIGWLSWGARELCLESGGLQLDHDMSKMDGF